jgi:hypothetical protein
MLTLKQRQERAARRAARIAAKHEAIRQAACQNKEGSTIMQKKAKVAGTRKAATTPTAAHGAAGKPLAAKEAKGAKPAASALAEDKLSPGARADLVKVREAAAKPDPALDKALADAGKAKAAKSAQAKGPKKPSLLDLAAEVLAKAGKPMGCKEIVEQVLLTAMPATSNRRPYSCCKGPVVRKMTLSVLPQWHLT